MASENSSHSSRPRRRWLQSSVDRTRARSSAIWSSLGKNNLWRRMFKFSLATLVTVIVVLVPAVVVHFPMTAFLAPLTTIFAHAGQRLGLAIEGLLMLLTGAVTGTAWAVLGLWLSSLAVEENEQGAYAIRALFLLCSVFHHGYIRSTSPRLIVYVLFHLTPATVILVGPWTEVTSSVVTNVAYPILIGATAVVVCNVLFFPELSCDYLAHTTIDAITQTTNVLSRSTTWFLQPTEDQLGLHEGLEMLPSAHAVSESAAFGTRIDMSVDPRTYRWYGRFLSGFRNPFHAARKSALLRPRPTETTSLASLTESKGVLRSKLQSCRAGQSEVNLEMSIGSLPPNSLKPISSKIMKSLVHNTITVIGSCENKFVLVGDGTETDSDESDGEEPASSRGHPHHPLDNPLKQVELVKPLREVEAGDPEVLEAVISQIRAPVQELLGAVKQSSRLVTRSLSYCYGLKRLPSGARTPNSVGLEELDARIDAFVDAIDKFDHLSTEELQKATSAEYGELDVRPHMETFLVSSFVLGIRQAAMHLLQMLRHARALVEQRQARRFNTSIHVPGTSGWRTWLSTGGERDGMVLPKMARKKGRTGRDTTADKKEEENEKEEPSSLGSEDSRPRQAVDGESAMNNSNNEKRASPSPPRNTDETDKKHKNSSKKAGGFLGRIRTRVADTYESLQRSDDSIYAMKLVVAFFIVSWPGFVPSWREWYAAVRGVWVPLQVILIFEVAIGTSLFVFVIRLVGVIYGCLMGFLAYEIGGGNKFVIVAVMVIAIVPSVYLQLGTKYVKTGMVALSSMTAVALAPVNGGNKAYEYLYLRLVTFFIGCSAGLLVELVLYPARARDRMAEAISSSIRQITNMQTVIAVGVDDPTTSMNLQSQKIQRRFDRSREKAQTALGAAETFLPFCLTEPRLKGSFRHLHPIYKEIIYVVHQIVDRMDNMLQLRRAYGSSVLEDLNPQVHAYRRAVSASIAMSLFAVNEALTTQTPLPQFLPSARLAMLRLIQRVGEVLEQKAKEEGSGEVGVGAYMARPQESEGADVLMDERVAKIIAHHKYLSWNANAAGQMEIIEYLEELVELAKLLVGVNAFRSGVLERPTFTEYAQRTRSREMPVGGYDGGGDDGAEDGGRVEPHDTAEREMGVWRRATDLLRHGTIVRREHAGATRQEAPRHEPSMPTGEEDAADQVGDDVGRTLSQSSSRRRQREGSQGHREEPEIPISLQRVSTRRATLRKRKATISGRDDGKGKGVEEEP